ncbi:ABC transporter permease [Arenicella xantha]|uniref:ABC-2 type transport system permease protein/lipopolysaccharide transport system permease protein n=1 Tax=Arenicella xantha TaxID=644221 RepID=A0A395JQK1_9GAMM|nr:ABC transporter permease [Arenicella xantha]RBP51000.1 ABC-2 type transport system permease protein/lipopolysaccharide transport system permease protein [Arenicella xantha]
MTESSDQSSNLRLAFLDIQRGLLSFPIFIALGWNDVRNRYNRSKLGVFWASMSILIFVAAIGPVYARLMGVEVRIYLLHLLLGFIIWNYISSIIMESGREFINSAGFLVSFQLSYFTLLFRVVWRNLIVLMYQMLVFLVFSLVLQHPVKLVWAVAPVALLLLTLNALWMALLMSVFATRFRDVSELMNNIFRLVFFITPIMWMPSVDEDLALVANLNPVYHLIEVYRQPLLYGEVEWNSWHLALLLVAVGWCVALPVFAKYRNRIAFWL